MGEVGDIGFASPSRKPKTVVYMFSKFSKSRSVAICRICRGAISRAAYSFVLLDPDPYSEYGQGYESRFPTILRRKKISKNIF
jgi:hypothetical protein